MKNNIKIPSNKSFGVIFFLFFFMIALWPLTYDGNPRVWLLVLSFISLFLGLINSQILTPLNKFWTQFGVFLGSFISPIIMVIIFFFVVTPIALIIKALNKDLLNLKKQSDKKTYWIEKEKYESSMKNQF